MVGYGSHWKTSKNGKKLSADLLECWCYTYVAFGSLRQKKSKITSTHLEFANENELLYAAELASFQKDMPQFRFFPFYSTKNVT